MRGGTKGSKKPASASRKSRAPVSRFGKTSTRAAMAAANAARVMNVEEENIRGVTAVAAPGRLSDFEKAKATYAQLEFILSQPSTMPGHPSKGQLWQLYHKFNKSLRDSVRGGDAIEGSGVYFAAQKSLSERVAQRARDLGQKEANIMNALSGKMAGTHI